MLCMYICAISCWQWAVKWLLRTLLSIWVWISELNLDYCWGNVQIHWQKSVVYTNDCWLLSRAGAVAVLALELSRCWCGGQQKHLRSTETLAGGKGDQATQKQYLFPERKIEILVWVFSLLLLLFFFWDHRWEEELKCTQPWIKRKREST